MADEEKIVNEKEEKVIEEGSQKKEEEIKEKEVQPREEFDASAFEELKTRFGGIEEENKKYKSDLEKVRNALLGDDVSKKDEEAFYKKLGDSPKEAFEELIKKNIEPIKERFEKQELAERDRISFTSLRTLYPDFDEVIKDAPRYLTKEEIVQTESLPNRTEIRFNLIRGRRELDMRGKNIIEKNELNKAKEQLNKTARTEIPTGGGKIEMESEDDILDSSINEAREKGLWNKGDNFSKLDEKIFERFQRDVYGIGRKK